MVKAQEIIENWRALTQERALLLAEKGTDPLSWLGPADRIAQNPQSADQLIRIMDILKRNPNWTFESFIPRPPAILNQSLATDVEKLSYIADGLQERERIFKAFKNRFGQNTLVGIKLGDKEKSLAIRFGEEIGDGSLCFSLIDTDAKVELGLLSADFLSPDLLLINTLQPHAAKTQTWTEILRAEKDGVLSYEKTPTEYIANQQHAIRRWSAKNEGSSGYRLNDTTKSVNPGIEEVLVAGVLKALQESGIINNSTRVFIPTPENAVWGSDWNIGSRFASWKQFQENISGFPEIRKQIIDILTHNYLLISKGDRYISTKKKYQESHLFYTVLYNALRKGVSLPDINLGGEKISAYKFFCLTLVNSISDKNSRDEALKQVQNFDDKDLSSDNAEKFGILIGILGQKSSTYRRQFHTYYSALSNIENQIYDETGRYIEAGSILQKKYAQRIILNS